MVGAFSNKLEIELYMQIDSKKVLITGASGFIGGHVCRHLLNLGYRVRALIRKADSLDMISHANLERVSGDLRKPSSLHTACDSVDIIVHLAGIAHTNNVKPEKLFDINTSGTESLLTAAVSQKVKKIIFSSSTLAGTLDNDGSPTTSYGKSKLQAEKLLLAAHNAGLIEVLVLRPVNVYGSGMRGNISTLINLIAKNRMPFLPILKTRISLIGINDVAQAIKLAMEINHAGGKIYTLTDGEVYIITDLEHEIYQVLEKKTPSWRYPRLALYLSLVCAGILAKALSILGLDRLSIAGVSARTYRNLTTDNLFDNSEALEQLGFKPSETFYSSLPKWITDCGDNA